MDNKLYPESYSRWTGNLSGKKPDYTRCCETVYDREVWSIGHQCRRKRGFGPDQAYCKQHNPQAVESKSVERARKHKEEKHVQDFGHLFLDALREIANGHPDPKRVAQDIIDYYEEGLK